MAEKRYLHDINLDTNRLLNARIHPVTTAQRSVLASQYDTGDEGVLVFDVNLDLFFVWDGVKWVTIGGSMGNLEGGWDASSGSFPVGQDPIVGTKKGDYWYVTTAGTVDGASFNVGDVIIAKVDNASTTSAADWIQLEVNRQQATETILGLVEIATQTETNAGISDTTAITPLKLKTLLDNRTITLTGDVTGSGTTSIPTVLSNTGVVAGNYPAATITVDSKGRVLAASSTLITTGTIAVVNRTIQIFTATLGQTTFNITGGYTPGNVDVFYNGAKLNIDEFTAGNGTTVVLNTPIPFAGDLVEVIIYGITPPTGIPAVNIGSGTVDNTEFGYLNGVTSSIQTQLDGKAASNHTHALDDLTDVVITSPVNNQVLKYNGTSWVNATSPGGASALDDLTDVVITTPTVDQILKYNGTNWVNAAAPATGVSSIATTGPITGGTITSTGTIGISQATTSTDGYLSSTDWNTFNNKQNVLTNPVTGTGTSGQVAFWNSTTTQSGSNDLFWDTTNARLGIGTNTPGARLSVAGTISTTEANGGVTINTSGVAVNRSGSGGISFSGNNGNGVSLINSAGTVNVQGSGDVALIAGNTSTLRIYSSTRNVVIQNGGTFTDGGYRLDVNGTTRFLGSSTFGTLGTGTGMFWDNTNNRLGIGLASPSYGLHITHIAGVYITGTGSSSGGYINFTPGGGNAHTISANILNITTTNSTNFTANSFLFTNSVGHGTINFKSKLYVADNNSGAFVGVNTTSPSFQLDVNGTARVSGNFTVNVNSSLLKTNASGVVSAAVAGTDYQAASTNLTSLAGLAYVSTSFVKMTAAGSFELDTNTYYLASNPSGYTTNTGTVTSISVVSANGFAGTVATASSTPEITITTTVTGLLKGNGTAISAAVAGTDYLVSNQTITLSGAVTGSGTTAITTTLANSVVGIANLSATGTPSASTYLRGDNTWAIVTAGAVALDDLTDVVITTPSNGQVLQYNGTNWVNVTNSATIAIGSSITSATAGSVLFAGTSGVLAQSNAQLFWDNTNNRLGIKTSSPTAALAVGSSKLVMYDATPTGALASTKMGYLFSPFGTTGTTLAGSFVEDDGIAGTILSYAVNAPQLSARNTAYTGGIFRLDTRPGEDRFVVWGYATGGSVATERISVSLQNGNTFLVPSSGSVSIGIATNVVPTFKFDVNGTTRLQGNTTISTGNLSISSLTSGSILFVGANGLVNQNNAQFFWDNTNNRLAIGHTSPTQLIDVRGATARLEIRSTNNSSNAAFLLWARGATGVEAAGGLYYTGHDTAANRYFSISADNATDQLVIMQGGNVMVGTNTNGGFKFDVNGTARIQGQLTVPTGTNGGILFGGSKIVEAQNQTTFTQVLIQPSSGNKSAVFQFAPSGTATASVMEFWNSSTTTGTGAEVNRHIFKNNNGVLQIGADASAKNVELISNNVPRITMFSGGNVVIQASGTHSDFGFRLDVNGTFRAQGQLTVSTGGAAITGATTISGNTTVNSGSTLTLSDMTSGSVLFAGTSGVITQDNSNFFWDDTNNRLGVGTNSPANSLDIVRGTAGTMARGTYETASFSYNADNKIGLYYAGAAGSGGVSLLFGATNFTANSTYPGFELQFSPSSTLASNYMRFNYVGRNAAGTVTVSTADIFNIFQGGNITVGTGTNGGFKFDVNGTARFQGNTTVSTGTLTVSALTVNGGLLYTSSTGVLSQNSALFYSTGLLTLGTGTAANQQIKFNYGSNSGGDFTGQLSGADQMSFGFNNTAAYGGTANAASGRMIYFYDRVSAVNIVGASLSGFYVGPTNTNYTFWAERPNASVAGIKITAAGNLEIGDSENIILGTTTGTKIGTATTQKIGFFNATPVVQPTGSIKTALSNIGLVASPTIPVADISATGTADGTTFLRGDGVWATPAGGGGSGTVTSVSFTAPANMSVTGSPITTSGTFALSFQSGFQAEDSTENEFALISSFKTLYNY